MAPDGIAQALAFGAGVFVGGGRSWLWPWSRRWRAGLRMVGHCGDGGDSAILINTLGRRCWKHPAPVVNA